MLKTLFDPQLHQTKHLLEKKPAIISSETPLKNDITKRAPLWERTIKHINKDFKRHRIKHEQNKNHQESNSPEVQHWKAQALEKTCPRAQVATLSVFLQKPSPETMPPLAWPKTDKPMIMSSKMCPRGGACVGVFFWVGSGFHMFSIMFSVFWYVFVGYFPTIAPSLMEEFFLVLECQQVPDVAIWGRKASPSDTGQTVWDDLFHTIPQASKTSKFFWAKRLAVCFPCGFQSPYRASVFSSKAASDIKDPFPKLYIHPSSNQGKADANSKKYQNAPKHATACQKTSRNLTKIHQKFN